VQALTQEITMSQNHSQILIAGASGNIGSALVANLKQAGVPFETMSSREGAGSRVARFEDRASLQRAFAGIDTLFVVLPLVPNKLELAANVAAAAKAAGVKHIVRSSGAGADPAAGFALPRLQGQVDAMLADTGIATTFLRPAGFMQNYTTFLAGMVKSGTLVLASGDAAQSLIDARDIADVASVVLQQPAAHAGHAYTLTGGEAQTDTERGAILGAAIGRPIHTQFISPEAAVQSMQGMGFPPALVEWMDSLNRLVAMGYAAGVSPDVQKLLGRAPRRFADFAQQHAAVWR
jgi:uncharacterized protein YbjT (DUF2867 family)